MIRRIIRIDEEKCNGCGACAAACHEGAIKMIDGKAKLTREDYCDGLGDCLPACPTGAISFEMREAPAYDEAAVLAAKRAQQGSAAHGGCPGSRSRTLQAAACPTACPSGEAQSQLRQWPVQLRLAPISAAYFDDAHLLIAADCTAYAYAGFHNDYLRGRIALIGCPKLDPVDYSEKLGAILAANNVRSVTVLRMEVPCCGGIEMAARRALERSAKHIPLQVVTVGIDGRIVS